MSSPAPMSVDLHAAFAFTLDEGDAVTFDLGELFARDARADGLA